MKLVYETKAYAKINLGLDVYPLEDNAFKHRIKSLFILIKQYYDEIKIYESDHLQVEYYMNDKLISIDNDIVTKTINYFKSKLNIEFNYHIVINKQIPLYSGLGGSSTDGAAIAKFIIETYHVNLNKKDLLDMSLVLSSDMCFFLSDCDVALVSQYGNKVKKIYTKNLPNIKVVLTNFPCDTKRIYEAFDKSVHKRFKIANNYYKIIRNFNHLNHCIINNDLEPIAFNIYPQLVKLKKSNNILTGSGSSFIEWEE